MPTVLIRHFPSASNRRPDLVGGYRPETRLSLTPEDMSSNYKMAGDLVTALGLLGVENPGASVYSSPAVRCKSTALIVHAAGLQLPSIEIAPALAEVCQGEFEGRPRSEVYTEDVLKGIQELGDNFTPPGGESLATAKRRIKDWYDSISGNSGLRVLFGHGLAFKLLIAELYGLDRTWIMNTEFNNGHCACLPDEMGGSKVPTFFAPKDLIGVEKGSLEFNG